MGQLIDCVPLGSRCALDSCCFIYMIADTSPYAALVQPLLRAIHQGTISGITSVVTVTEVLTKPEQQQDAELVFACNVALQSVQHLTIMPLDLAVAQKAAALRGRYGLRTPDAYQLAVAIQEKCSVFITNDKRLRGVTDIAVVILDDLITDIHEDTVAYCGS